MLRAGLIGCGRIGSDVADDPKVGGVYSHAEAYIRARGVELVAIADTDIDRARRCAGRWALPAGAAFDGAEDLLANALVDVVSVCTPDETHEDILRQVLDSGVRGVLIEKPLAMTTAAAERLVSLADEAGVALVVDYHRRFADGMDRARALIGDLGPLQVASCLYSGGLLHNGTHLIDTLRFLCGEVMEVEGWDELREGGADPTLDGRLWFENGGRAVVSGCKPTASVFELDLVLDRGRVRVTDHGNTITSYVLGDLPFYSGYQGFVDDGKTWPILGDVLLHAVEDLVAAVVDGRSPRCTGLDGVAALRVAEAITESVVMGRQRLQLR